MAEERKLVSILFADVTGSTALGEMLDPEDMRALMGRYYDHARRVVTSHGGTIEKFIGDAVMAVFGLPQAHGDDAERALAAAMALLATIAADEVLGEEFQLRIGVNTGEVVATSDASRGDFLVTGDAVNVAARLQQAASPGEIIAGERTAAAAQTAFVFADARFIEVKGKRQPLRVFLLKGRQQTRKVNRPSLVGRKQDLMQLALLEARTVEEQRPQLISIVAPAGTGKTRLLEEFIKRLDPDEGFEVATVRCLPYGQTLTYWPLRGLLIELLGEEISKTRVTSIFNNGGYKADDAARLADNILTTLGIEGESMGAKDRESIFTAWRLLIEVLARQAPRILVFEDLHWASDSLLDLVEHIINLRTQAALLLIALSRPELLDRRPTWGGGRQNFTALALQPLTTVQTQELIKKIMVDMPEATRTQIVERSGGNPFFALELLRGLQERGLTGEAATLDVLPDTVHAAVLARLDLLTKQERTVLQVAAVASRAIRSPMLHAVLNDYTLDEIATAFDGLVARDMLISSDNEIYTFRHILIRDVAYGTLSRAERVRLHSRIAAWLETATAEHLDEYVELLAYHYREAVVLARQSAVPKPMPIETERAIYFLKRAGAKACSMGAFVETRTHLQNAIALAPASEHLALYELLGDSLPWGDTSAQAYLKAIEVWRESYQSTSATTEQQEMGARLLRKLLVVCNRGFAVHASAYEQQADFVAEGLQLATKAENMYELWRLRVAEGFLWNSYGKVTAIERERKRAEMLAAAEYFETRKDWEASSEALDACTTLFLMDGIIDEAEKVIRRRLDIPELSSVERADAIGMYSYTFLLRGDYKRCTIVMRSALAKLPVGTPLQSFSGSIPTAMIAAFVAGLWSDIPFFADKLKELMEQIHYDEAIGGTAFAGYIPLLLIALAREDRPAQDAAIAALNRRTLHWSAEQAEQHRSWVSVYYEDEPRPFDFGDAGFKSFEMALHALYWNEHNKPMRASEIEQLTSVNDFDFVLRVGRISQAIAANDNVQLATAIDEAEEHGLVVHAARMHIVLAQRTGDFTQLDRTRSILEGLQDYQYLKRLADVLAIDVTDIVEDRS